MAYRIENNGAEPFEIHPEGRIEWALRRLMEAGAHGCTPITQPAPRWSDYVFKLRGLGVSIETIYEPHGGAYPGHHGRYVLRSKVTRIASGKDEVAA